jgi:hypothetical protein
MKITQIVNEKNISSGTWCWGCAGVHENRHEFLNRTSAKAVVTQKKQCCHTSTRYKIVNAKKYFFCHKVLGCSGCVS